MTVIEDDLVTILKAANTSAGNRLHDNKLPEGATLPAIVYTRISTTFAKQFNGKNLGLYRPRMQLDCWGDDYAAATTLADEVQTAMDGHGDATILGAATDDMRDLPDPDTDKRRRIVDVFLDHI